MSLAISEAAAVLAVAPSDYVELFSPPLPTAWCARPPRPGLRVRILGPLEARLTESDRVILGGLVEGAWPPESRTDAWLSRPMRHEARPRSARAPHRAFGARFRPDCSARAT